MADGPVEDQFPQPIAAPEEAQAAPAQAAPASQPAQNEAQNAKLAVFGFWLVHNLGVCFHGTLLHDFCIFGSTTSFSPAD